MWFDPADVQQVVQGRIRHEAQQDDKLASYGWVRHDGRSYGRQELVDGDHHLTVQMVRCAGGAWSCMRWQREASKRGAGCHDALAASPAARPHRSPQVKVPSPSGAHGGDWAVRVRAALSDVGKQRLAEEKAAAAAGAGPKPRKRKLSLLLYFADAHWRSSEVEMWPEGEATTLGQVRARWAQLGRGMLQCQPQRQHGLEL